MNHIPITRVASGVFVLIAALQLCRIALQWTVEINGHAIPFWISGLAVVVTVTLAVLLWRAPRAAM